MWGCGIIQAGFPYHHPQELLPPILSQIANVWARKFGIKGIYEDHTPSISLSC